MKKQFALGTALQQRDFDQELSALSAKRMLAYQIEKAMASQLISRVEMAKRMNTSRAALNRLLDADNDSVTLQTIQSAAEVLNLEVVLTLKPKGE